MPIVTSYSVSFLFNELFKQRSLKYILFSSVSVILCLVSVNMFFIYPSFTKVLIQQTENEAIRVGSHLSKMIKNELVESKKGESFFDSDLHIMEILNDFGLEKLKIFNKDGLTVFSSDSKDIGKINEYTYFRDTVSKGKVYTKLVKKDKTSLEGEMVSVDVVETYIPMMSNSIFSGALEIYYDVTKAKVILDKQFIISSTLLFLLSIIFMVLIFIPLRGMIINIAERQIADTNLNKLYRNTRQILESMPFGVILVGRDRIIRSANKAAVSMMGLTDEKEITHQICHNKICPAEERNCPVLDLGQKIDNTERTLLGKNGKKIPIMKTVLPITMNDEDLLLEAFVDITEINKAKKKIEETNQRLEKSLQKAEQLTHEAQAANKAKSQFLANMSHEIRTPLNGMIGMAELLGMTELSEIQNDYVETLEISGNSLLSLVNAILDQTKIEEGKLELEAIDFDLRVTLDELSDIAANLAETKGIEYINNVSPDIPSRLKGDPGRLRQILINFVNNAIKFTEQGEVVTKVTLKEEGKNKITLLFTVTDTGIGIPEDRMDRLFKAFSQVDSSMTRKYGGTGLGLLISKQLIEKMGGETGVKSEAGKGSEFWFTAVFEKHDELNPFQLIIPGSVKDKRVLIVDDNKTNRFVLSEQLKYWGCMYDEASNGHKAIEKLITASKQEAPFEIAIIDMQMPGMTGEELGRQIKKNPDIQNTKMIMMTSIGQRGDAKKIEKIGFDAYLIKPVKQAKLLGCLKAISENSPVSFPETPKKIITQYSVSENEKNQIRILLVEDNKINQKVALNIIKKLGYHADLANNGREAVLSLMDKSYDVILMDCQMPEMDGYEAAKYIRDPDSKILKPNVPIIALTAHALTGDREKCLNAGMDDYLTKPVKPKQLSEVLKKWIKAKAS